MTEMVFADHVSKMEALKKAEALMPGKKFEMEKFSTPSDGKAAEEPFYIFNVSHGGGYVLVSAEDQTTAILGYSTNGNIDLDDIPDNVRYWLDYYAAEINAVKEGRLKASPDRSQATRANIEPLMKTKWNQDEPYNLMCPDGKGVDWNAEGYDAGNRCVSGCVATAVAQVMYYHRWPLEPTTDIPSYWSNRLKVTLNALPPTTFDWNSMKLSYSKSETGVAADAVAELMRYVGQGLYMNYGTADNGGSGANIYNDVMVNCFNYSKKIHSKDRNCYTTTQWENMVYEELRNNRPVPYGGFAEDGSGHQFVCDGYQDGLFHLNWGWGGSLDGFFILSIADPDGEQGIGGSTGAFKLKQDAVFYFMPAAADEEEVPIVKSSDGIINATLSTYTRDQASEDFSDVTVPLSCEFWYSYIPTSTYNIEVGWGLYRDEELLQCIGSDSGTIDMRELTNPNKQFQIIKADDFQVSFGANLPDGKYQLRQIFRKADSNEAWTLMDNYGIYYLVAEISGNSLTVRPANITTESFLVNDITLSDEPTVGMDLDVTVNITNTSDLNRENIRLWTAPQGTSDWTKVVGQTAYLGPGETGDVNLRFQPAAAGALTLKVTTGASEEALYTRDFTVAEVVEVTVDDFVFTCIPAYRRAIIKSGGDDKTKPSLTIPTTVTASNTECRVKAIGDRAFYGWENITSLVIPEGIESIGNRSFMLCSSLTRLILPSTLKSIDEKAFFRIDPLSEVVSNVQVPFAIGNNTFKRYDFDIGAIIPSEATLYVPIGTKEAYEAITGWSVFKGIGEINLTNGDANGDGSENMTDAVDAISYLLGQTPDNFDASAVDMNGDGLVTVTDIILLMIAYSLIP